MEVFISYQKIFETTSQSPFEGTNLQPRTLL